jgi:hypothetical protein
MRSVKTRALGLLLPCLTLGLVACDDDVPLEGTVDAAMQDIDASSVDTGPIASDASLPEVGAADAAPVRQAMGIAVVGKDFSGSMTLSLLNPTTRIIDREGCVDSGSRAPQLSTAFSSDIMLPSQARPDGRVVIIDRKNATLTFVNPTVCAVERQINVSTGFSANPQDVALAAGKLFVPRYNGNANATAATDDFDEGHDVLVLEAASGVIRSRIDLRAHAGQDRQGRPSLPRAQRALELGGTVYVSLNNLAPRYDDAGPGRVVAIDPVTETVSRVIDLPGLRNCGALMSAGTGTLLVACGGVFEDGDEQVDAAGVARVTLATGSIQVLPSKVFGGRAISWEAVAALDDNTIAAVVLGGLEAMSGAEFWIGHIEKGTAEKIHTASGPWDLVAVVADPTRRLVYLADANDALPRVRVFDLSNSAKVVPGPVINATLRTGLPPQVLSWY